MEIKQKMIFNCPLCNIERIYTNEISFFRAKKEQLKCKRCCQIGKKYPIRKTATLTEEQKKKRLRNLNTGIPWNKGKTNIYSDETIQKIRQKSLGRFHTEETKNRISEKMTNRNISETTKIKIGNQSRIRQLKRLLLLGIPPHEDKGAKNYFQWLNMYYGFNFNNKRFNDIGYIADGYDEKNHIWIEYDTPYHNRKYQQKKDCIRQYNIIKYFENMGNPLKNFIRVKVDKNDNVIEEKYVNKKTEDSK